MDDIIIKFDEFEGPLELLIEVIKKRELDIYDLPMSVITKDFTASVSEMKKNDIEVTSQFVSMASLLLKIKTEMLLPTNEIDPRQVLVKELENYEKYKANLEKIQELQYIEQTYFKRTKKDIKKKNKAGTIADVFKSLEKIMRKRRQIEKNEILEEFSKKLLVSNFTIDERMNHLMSLDEETTEVNDMFESINDLEEMVVTFSAILELVKEQKLFVKLENEKVYLRKARDHRE